MTRLIVYPLAVVGAATLAGGILTALTVRAEQRRESDAELVARLRQLAADRTPTLTQQRIDELVASVDWNDLARQVTRP